MQERSRRGIEALADEPDELRAVARCGGDGAESQPFGGARGGVANGDDRPAALVACFSEGARTVGAIPFELDASRRGCVYTEQAKKLLHSP